ncbi:uncharacterized protein [Manis javanica]|uniref:uncharacterized protein n=1 Tax=Manis javanica TaxID=9974 RepID=UPI003C6CFE06
MKRKRKRKHLETTRSLKAARMSGGPIATDAAAAASEFLSCVPCENKPAGAGVSKLQASGTPPWYLEDETVGPEKNDGPCGSEYYTSGSSLDSASSAEIFKKQKHIGEPGNLPQKELENTSTSDYSSSLSDYENSEITKLPEDVPRVGALEMTPPQVWEEREASSSSPSSSTSPSSSSSTSSSTSSPVPVSQQGESSLFPQHMDTAPIREIYYRRVFLKRDVTVWWGGVEVLEPTSKKTKLVQCVFSQVAQKTSGAFLTPKSQNTFLRRPSYVSPPKRLTDMECSSDNNALQGRVPAGGAGEPPAQEEGSRAKTPQGLGTLDSGFRCLGCYQVFHSLEVLQAHVENAARERFSCHVFNRAFAQMISKHKKRARELGEHQDENVYLPDQKRPRSKTSSCK